MIFFRTQTVPFRLTRSGKDAEEIQRLFFIEAQASYEGDVDPLTGMVVNLVDADQWIHQAAQEIPEAASLQDYAQKFFTQLKQKSEKLSKVEVSKGQNKVSFDGKTFTWKFQTKSFFLENGFLVQREVRFQTASQLKKKWLKDFKGKFWNDPQDLVRLLQKEKLGIQSIEVVYPERQFSLKLA